MFAKSNSPPQQHTTGVAAVGIGIGVIYLVVGMMRHQPISGIVGLAIMLAYVGLLYGLRRWSEPGQLLSANPADERQEQVMLRATAFTGRLLVVAVVGSMLVSMVVGSQYTAAFSALAALGGGSFIAATVWYSRRI